jgi:hypothetical protein
MRAVHNQERAKGKFGRLLVMAGVGLFAGVMSVAPIAAAAKSGDATRVVKYRAVDRAEILNLQRWVTAGHEDWCKDARLVATEELKRMAADFAGDAGELQALAGKEGVNGGDDAKKITFEWAPLDGRAMYRVTVERFEWLLPIAGDARAVVWVPTVTETQNHDGDF